MTTHARAEELAGRLAEVRARIARTAGDAGRDPEELTLIVVTKHFPASDIRVLAELGVRDVGENRHQEAEAKAADPGLSIAGAGLRWHFIGNLQSNKATAVASYADAVHSVDRAKLLTPLARGRATGADDLDVLVQVDLDQSPQPGRGGARPEAVEELAARIEETPRLRLRGVMAVAPLGGDPAEAFGRLRKIADRIRAAHPAATWISAGMSGDLEQAITQGATHLRVGSAVLGSRPITQ